MSLFHAHFISIDLLILFQQADFHSQRKNAPCVTLDAAESHLRNEMGLDARKPVFGGCEQHWRRPACASAQSDQRLCYSLFGKCHM